MDTLAECREFFKNDKFAQLMGAQIEEVGEHYAKCSIKLDERHKNAVGGIMGGVYFTLADFTFAVAANSKKEGVVSLDASISYLGVVKGEMLIAQANCIKNGRTTNYYEIRLTDEKDNMVAVVHMTGFRKQ